LESCLLQDFGLFMNRALDIEKLNIW